MAQQTAIQKPLVEQIIEEMLASLAEREEFDPETIQRLEQLAAASNLSKPKRVAESLMSAQGARQ